MKAKKKKQKSKARDDSEYSARCSGGAKGKECVRKGRVRKARRRGVRKKIKIIIKQQG